MKAQRITMVTLSVYDLEKSRVFYHALGFKEAGGGAKMITFYWLSGQYFALYARKALSADIGMQIADYTTGGITLATNYNSKQEVDAAFICALAAGAQAIKAPKDVYWGGYSGTYTDLDGHLWEVAYNPFSPLDANGLIAKNT